MCGLSKVRLPKFKVLCLRRMRKQTWSLLGQNLLKCFRRRRVAVSYQNPGLLNSAYQVEQETEMRKLNDMSAASRPHRLAGYHIPE